MMKNLHVIPFLFLNGKIVSNPRKNLDLTNALFYYKIK